MNAMTKTPVCVVGNTELFNKAIEEILRLQTALSNLCLPSPFAVEDGFDENLLTNYGNAIRSLEEAYNGLIIFARCNAFGIVPVNNGMLTPDNDSQSAV